MSWLNGSCGDERGGGLARSRGGRGVPRACLPAPRNTLGGQVGLVFVFRRASGDLQATADGGSDELSAAPPGGSS